MPPLPNKGALLGDRNSEIMRTALKMNMETPMKKGYKPGPGRLKVPKPYAKEIIMMTTPKTVRTKANKVSS
jgi:hypothetical protein